MSNDENGRDVYQGRRNSAILENRVREMKDVLFLSRAAFRYALFGFR